MSDQHKQSDLVETRSTLIWDLLCGPETVSWAHRKRGQNPNQVARRGTFAHTSGRTKTPISAHHIAMLRMRATANASPSACEAEVL